LKAIETVPTRKQEPILEPHYKLVSTVHKMVRKKAIKVRSHPIDYAKVTANGLLCRLLKGVRSVITHHMRERSHMPAMMIRGISTFWRS
jgi:hypothetical protein